MLLAALFSFTHLLQPHPLADAVFVHGNIYTVDSVNPRAQAIGVENHRIIYVGSEYGAMAYRGKSTQVIDLHGATVVPGLTDAHYHLDGVGAREENFNLEGTNSLAELQEKIAAKVKLAKPGAWIVGSGWIETTWKPPVFPTKDDLDKVSPLNPVFISRSDGHGAVANSLALRICGITKNTPSPSGGKFVLNPNSGELTGMILDEALGRIEMHLPIKSDADI